MLLLIGIVSVAGTWYIYSKSDDEDSLKKTMALFLALIIILSTVFMIYDTGTREMAMGAESQNQSILAILLGWTSGGYSPYIKESWGGTGPYQDFDYDGIKNEWDEDADNDGVNDAFEYPTRFNPYQPDIGIKDMDLLWISDSRIMVRVEPIDQGLYTIDVAVKIYVDNIMKDSSGFYDTVEFTIDVVPFQQYTLDVMVEGRESIYANQANNLMSYTVPAGILGEFGKWYSDIENTIQGIIRNSPLFYAANEFSFLENLFRETFASIPIFIWIVVAAAVIPFWLWARRRKKKGKPPLFSFFRKKKPKYEKGVIKVQVY